MSNKPNIKYIAQLLTVCSAALLLFLFLFSIPELWNTAIEKIFSAGFDDFRYGSEGKTFTAFKIKHPDLGIVAFVLVQFSNFIFWIALLLVIFALLLAGKKMKSESHYLKRFIMVFFTLLAMEATLGFFDFEKPLGIYFTQSELKNGLKWQQQLKVDDSGINIFIGNSEYLPGWHRINEAGFRSMINFSRDAIDSMKRQNKYIVMLVGDSHVEGCCAEPITSSFPDLIQKAEDITVLNFGIGGTDPLQYYLIAEKYLHVLEPDLLIVAYCLNNDFMIFDRNPNPFQPLYYQTNLGWLSATLPVSHPKFKPDTYFDNFNQARSFYLEYHSVSGENINPLKKHFVLPSKLITFTVAVYKWLRNMVNTFRYKIKYSSFNNHNEKSHDLKYIQQIKTLADASETPFLLIGIPTIKDMSKNQETLQDHYSMYFNDFNFHYPLHLTADDFMSRENDHFNNSGHQKYSAFLLELIDSVRHHPHKILSHE